MTYGIFDDNELELINASKLILSDGVQRLKDRNTLFSNNRSDRRAMLAARSLLTDKLLADYGSLRYEVAIVVFFDIQGRLITTEEFKQGKAAECEISTRLLVEYVIKHGAAAILLAHNHPSGDNTPSSQDLRMTRHLKEWLAHIDCQVIDHLVLNGEGASSIIGEWND